MQVRGTPFAARTAAAAIALALAAVSALAHPASAHDAFVFTDYGIESGAPPSEWRKPALVLAGVAAAPATVDEFHYERQAAVWDASTERLLTMGGGMSCCRELEERDVEGNLLRFEVFYDEVLPYRVEQLATMGPRRVIGWGWGPNWPDDFRLFTFLREDPVGTLRTRDVLLEPTGMSCLGDGRIAVTHGDGTGFVRERGRGLVPFAVPMRARWSSFDGARLWMVGDGRVGFVPDTSGEPESWSCELALVPAGIQPERVVSLKDGHTATYGFGGVTAFVGDELTTAIAVPIRETPSPPAIAVGPGHRLWFSKASGAPANDARGRAVVVDWLAHEPPVEWTVPGKVVALAALDSQGAD